MSDQILNELGIPEPDVNLGVSGGTSNTQTAEIMLRLEPLVLSRRPALLIVALACLFGHPRLPNRDNQCRSGVLKSSVKGNSIVRSSGGGSILPGVWPWS